MLMFFINHHDVIVQFIVAMHLGYLFKYSFPSETQSNVLVHMMCSASIRLNCFEWDLLLRNTPMFWRKDWATILTTLVQGIAQLFSPTNTGPILLKAIRDWCPWSNAIKCYDIDCLRNETYFNIQCKHGIGVSLLSRRSEIRTYLLKQLSTNMINCFIILIDFFNVRIKVCKKLPS